MISQFSPGRGLVLLVKVIHQAHADDAFRTAMHALDVSLASFLSLIRADDAETDAEIVHRDDLVVARPRGPGQGGGTR